MSPTAAALKVPIFAVLNFAVDTLKSSITEIQKICYFLQPLKVSLINAFYDPKNVKKGKPKDFAFFE